MQVRDCTRRLRKRGWYRWVIYACCFLPLTPSHASETLADARRLFSDGQEQFRVKQFDAAYDSFRKIELLGFNAPILQFNIGSAALKAGRLLEAREAFVKASVTTRFEALSYFNLGLVAIKREKRAEALTWFTRSYGATTNSKLRALCVEMSARLLEEGVQKTVSKDDWHVSAGAGLGYEDGFIDPLDEAITQGNFFIDANTLAQKPFFNGPNWNIVGRGELFHTNNNNVSELNATQFGLALEMHLDRKIWRSVAAIGVNDLILGGASYETVSYLSMQWSRTFGALITTLRYEFDYHFPAAEFSNFKGTQHEWRSDVAWRWKSILLHSQYSFETNNRADSYEDGGYSNSSPNRHQLELGARWDLTDRQAIIVSVDSRRTEYRFPDVAVISEQKGVETRGRTRTQWIFSPTSSLSVSLNWEYLENESPRQEYSFSRHQVRLGCDYAIF